MSLLGDLLPRLGHSHAAIRKKTVVTLYRLALVYPEALRASWPKIKERLMDPDEDSSVTAAIVNVVCELGWRRPHDFLPLAPRLFELLVDGGNNWMAIKLIKLVGDPVLSYVAVAPLILTGLADLGTVCDLDAPGAASCTKAATAIDKSHPDHASHVSFVRVHQRDYPRRHPWRWRRLFSPRRGGLSLCHKTQGDGIR